MRHQDVILPAPRTLHSVYREPEHGSAQSLCYPPPLPAVTVCLAAATGAYHLNVRPFIRKHLQILFDSPCKVAYYDHEGSYLPSREGEALTKATPPSRVCLCGPRNILSLSLSPKPTPFLYRQLYLDSGPIPTSYCTGTNTIVPIYQ